MFYKYDAGWVEVTLSSRHEPKVGVHASDNTNIIENISPT